MSTLRPAYLIHGDDHGALAQRRTRLRRLAEASGGAGGVELLEGDAATPQHVARALATMTFALGHRVIIVDGTERWKDAEVRSQLSAALADMPAVTTVAFFAREEGRLKAPAALHDAVAKAGGQVSQEITVKPWELPRWVRAQAAQLGVSLDPAAATALVAQVGERQQRLLRELEKLALEGDDPTARTITAQDVEERAAHSTQWRAYALADALVAADTQAATLGYLRLRAQGERLGGMLYLMAQRLREAHTVAMRLRAGEPAAAIKRTLRMPARAADRFIADVRRSDPETLRRALEAVAQLEVDSRGGATVRASRSPMAILGEDTVALRAIATITS